jgi:hypothetical protein
MKIYFKIRESRQSCFLEQLRQLVFDPPGLLLLGHSATALDKKDYRLVDGYLPHAIRVTVDRDCYEMHADSVEFWTPPGSPTFHDLAIYHH